MNEAGLEELLMSEGWSINRKQLSDFVGEPLSQIQNVNQLKTLLLNVSDVFKYIFSLLPLSTS